MPFRFLRRRRLRRLTGRRKPNPLQRIWEVDPSPVSRVPSPIPLFIPDADLPSQWHPIEGFGCPHPDLQPVPVPFDPMILSTRLEFQGNTPIAMAHVAAILARDRVIVEIGCGSAEIAWEIASKNPGIGVLATDSYEYPCIAEKNSGYGRVAKVWKNRMLRAQIFCPANLAIVRAEVDILKLLPNCSIDTILLVNPEPRIGRSVLDFLAEDRLMEKIKPGPLQIVIKPFSREMGISVCGGPEFNHGNDWSRGLGFLMENPFHFQKGERIQWSVNLGSASPYSSHSTQSDVYTHGTDASALLPHPKHAFRLFLLEKLLRIHRPQNAR